jgi:DNA-binding winged helix-turn-helix (wHTH) protein
MNEALLRLLEVLTTPGDAGSVLAKQDLLANVLSTSGVRADYFIVE